MKVCPFCMSSVPLTAAECPKCGADLVQYLPGVKTSAPQRPHQRLRLLLFIVAGILVVAASIGVYLPLVMDRPTPPVYTTVGRAGDTRFVVVPPDEAHSDADLWYIADRLRGSSPTIHVMFWTNEAAAPTTGMPTAMQRSRMAAEILVNVGTGIHELHRPHQETGPGG